MSPAAAAGAGRPGKEPTAERSDQERAARGRRRAGGSLARLRAGEAISLIAAVLLFVLMFIDWFGVKPTTGGERLGAVVAAGGGGDAWQALEVIPLFLMLAIVVAVGAALLRLSGSDWKPAIPPGAAVCVLGGLAALLIALRIVVPPGPEGAFSDLSFETTVKPAIFLALAAALGIAYGGWRTMATEGTSFAAIAKRLESPRRPPRSQAAAKGKPAGRPKP